MTYKAAMAGLPLGGGKAVVIGNAKRDKSPALLEALGRCVDSLGGRYIIAEDVGTTAPDMAVIRHATRHVAGLVEGGSGDPSPVTAFGVHCGIRAAVAHKLRRNGLENIRVAVQGLGSVGFDLCRRLAADGARLIVTDINAEAVARAATAFGAEAVASDTIYDADADVFAPCALGAVINDTTIRRLRVAIVAGSANNQLAADRHGDALAEKGILFAPDYVINAGGLINISFEDLGPGGRTYDRDRALAKVAGIHDTLTDIFQRAARAGVATNQVADRLAEERIRPH
jgi:leucine dehydrogenase